MSSFLQCCPYWPNSNKILKFCSPNDNNLTLEAPGVPFHSHHHHYYCASNPNLSSRPSLIKLLYADYQHEYPLELVRNSELQPLQDILIHNLHFNKTPSLFISLSIYKELQYIYLEIVTPSKKPGQKKVRKYKMGSFESTSKSR